MLDTATRLSMSQVEEKTGRCNVTVRSWWQRGLRGIKLRVEVQGGRPYTCEAWLDEFFAACTAARQGGAGEAAQASSPAILERQEATHSQLEGPPRPAAKRRRVRSTRSAAKEVAHG